MWSELRPDNGGSCSPCYGVWEAMGGSLRKKVMEFDLFFFKVHTQTEPGRAQCFHQNGSMGI